MRDAAALIRDGVRGLAPTLGLAAGETASVLA
jgi:hypothetical protein